MRKSLRRPPLLAFLALSAGLAGALVLLTLLDAAIFRPIPGVREPQRLLSLESPPLSYPSFTDLARASTAAGSGLDGFAAFAHRQFAFSTGEGVEERRIGVVVAGDYFGTLGVRAAAGRLLGAADDRPGAPLAVVLSHALWRDRFGGGQDAIGQEVRLNGSPFRVIGVADASFRNLVRERKPDFWITAHAWIENAPSTFAGRTLDGRGWSWLRGFARLAPGAEVAAARARIQVEAERIRAAHPDDVGDDFSNILFLRSTFAAAGIESEGVARAVSFAISALAFLLVALAVSSAAHLFLARGEARRQELATRVALGADRRRITALLLVEPIACALAASLAALFVANRVLALAADQALPGGVLLGELGLAIDPALAATGALLALAAGAAAGLLPARRIWRDDPAKALGAARTVAHGSTRTRRALTVAQVAISLVLVAATALVARALQRATAIETGYDGDRLGFVTLDAGLGRLTPERALASYEAAVASVAALPEVEGASLVGALPLDPGVDVESFRVAGYTPAPDEKLRVETNLVGPGALSVLGIDLVAGRDIATTDRIGTEPVGVVSKRFVERYLGGRDPIGEIVQLSERGVKIVGVAEDVRAHGPGELQPPALYLAILQQTSTVSLWPQSIVYKTRGAQRPDAALANVVRAAGIGAPGVPVAPVGSYDSLLAAALAPQRFASGLFGAFSIVATLLAAAGLFGLVAHAAAARTRELGLRAALGAGPSKLVLLLVGSAFGPVAVGGALGAAAALPIALTARGLMVGLETFDLTALALAALLFAAVAALAALVPAVRGARLDPTAALRAE